MTVCQPFWVSKQKVLIQYRLSIPCPYHVQYEGWGSAPGSEEVMEGGFTPWPLSRQNDAGNARAFPYGHPENVGD